MYEGVGGVSGLVKILDSGSGSGTLLIIPDIATSNARGWLDNATIRFLAAKQQLYIP